MKTNPTHQPPTLPAVSRMTQKGQVTIPAPIRKRLGLKPRDHIDFVVDTSGVRITPSKPVAEMTAGIAAPQAKPADLKEERQAFEKGVAEEVSRELEEQARDQS